MKTQSAESVLSSYTASKVTVNIKALWKHKRNIHSIKYASVKWNLRAVSFWGIYLTSEGGNYWFELSCSNKYVSRDLTFKGAAVTFSTAYFKHRIIQNIVHGVYFGILFICKHKQFL